MNITTILVDLDGTLVESKDIHHSSLNHALQKNGCETIQEGDYPVYEGLSTKQKLRSLNIKGKVRADQFEQIEKDKQRKTVELYSKIKRDDKIWSTLNTLKNMGYKIALCTNSVPETTSAIIDRLEIRKFFDIIITNADVKKPKPDKEIYELAIKLTNTPACNCLVIEDGERGIAAAKAAGITQIVQVNSPFDMSSHFVLAKIREFNNLR